MSTQSTNVSASLDQTGNDSKEQGVQLPACYLVGLGAWGPGFEDWPALGQLLCDKAAGEGALALGAGPKPAVIPANERRRAPLSVRLAVETSWQAMTSADIDPKAAAFVFASGLGETALTDYICAVLTTEQKALSPTKFHNSVHNAPAGYWTISTGAQGAANSIAGFDHTVSLALMEAMIQCGQEQRPVLITCYDAPVPAPLQSVMPNTVPMACSLLLVPEALVLEGGAKLGGDANQSSAPLLRAQVISQASEWPEFTNPYDTFQRLYQQNPAARLLPLMQDVQACQSRKRQQVSDTLANDALTMPLSAGATLRVSLS